MECRPNCAACCIAPSISSSIPGMPNGKPAGVPCVQLDHQFRCAIFDSTMRPKVCSGFLAEKIICGKSQEEALNTLCKLEGIEPITL